MLAKGSLSRWLAGAFIALSLGFGLVAKASSVQDSADLANNIKVTGKTGAGILVGSASQKGDESFANARKLAAAPPGGAKQPSSPRTGNPGLKIQKS